MRLTPEEEAAYALHHGVSRADLQPQVQAVYDRLLEERKAAAARPWAGTLAPSGQPNVRAGHPRGPVTWQASSLRPEWQAELWQWLFAVPFLAVVAGFGGSDVALAVGCVAILAILYRLSRARRSHKAAKAAQPPPPSPFSQCSRCDYPFAAHFGDDLLCPLAGICYRCGRPLTGHAGYELRCPDSERPRCYRCGQPFAAHVGDGLMCPAPPVSVS
jgi:hypothetical protein